MSHLPSSTSRPRQRWRRAAIAVGILSLWLAFALAKGWLPFIPKLWTGRDDKIIEELVLTISLIVAGWGAIRESFIPEKESAPKWVTTVFLLASAVSIGLICLSNRDLIMPR